MLEHIYVIKRLNSEEYFIFNPTNERGSTFGTIDDASPFETESHASTCLRDIIPNLINPQGHYQIIPVTVVR